MGSGWGVGGKRRQSRTRAENQEPLSTGPTQTDFKITVRSCPNDIPGEVSARKDLGIPHYPDMKAYLTSLTSVYLF